MSGELWIGMVSVIVSVGVLPLSILYFLHRVRAKKLDTIIKLVELSGNVDADMMKSLGDGGNTYKTDYKYGLIWLAIGIPLFGGVWMESSIAEAVFCSIPILIGIAYLISGKYRLREAD